MTPVEIRPLQLRDLSAIEEIERRSYPTPWSRSMFAGELAKPSSIGLGAADPEIGPRLIGYLIVSRYVDAWHVMNLAVAHECNRRDVRCRVKRQGQHRRPGRSAGAARPGGVTVP